MPLTIIVIGLVFILSQWLTNLDNYLKAAFTKVDYPSQFQSQTYSQLLDKYVHDGLVNYRDLVQAKELTLAVDELAVISPEHFADNNEKLVFWINTYNLLILKSIANHYPLKEHSALIRDLSLRKFVIGGQTLAVDDVRTGKIYPLVDRNDPRAIFLTCGGTLGYPKLLSHAISTKTLAEDLEGSTVEFVTRLGNVVYDERSGTFFISQFFKWNESLFKESPFSFANRYLPKKRQIDFDDFHTKTRYLGMFNWTLNEEVQK